MPDKLVAATAPEAGVALAAAITTDLVSEIRNRHDLWPTATAAVGRLATGAALFGAGLKGNERISLQIAGDGPLATLAADSWLLDERTAAARGYTRHPRVDLPIDSRGKFDVAGAIGSGSLQVTRSSDVAKPYVGVVPLRSGEIADDIAVYLAQSEQIPSVVALGVLANPNGVLAAGGIIARALPGADERHLAELERRAAQMPPVTQLISHRPDAEALLRELAGTLGATRAASFRRPLRVLVLAHDESNRFCWQWGSRSCCSSRRNARLPKRLANTVRRRTLLRRRICASWWRDYEAMRLSAHAHETARAYR